MPMLTIVPAPALRRLASIACAGWLLAGVLLLSGRAALAGPDEPADDVKAAPTQPLPRPADAQDDEFLPIGKVVPRAKIVLKEKERLPDLKGEETFARYGRRTIEYAWSAREPLAPMYPFAYNPLYFEDMNLERCGLSWGCLLQPFASGIHFYGSVALLPYKMLVAPPCSLVEPPGDCPPGCHFNYCENLIGPPPDFSRLPGYRCLFRRGMGR